MSWIDEAKKDARDELKRENLKRDQAISANLLAQKQETAQKLQIFHQHTAQAKREIETVLMEARRQGLQVSAGIESHFSRYLGVGNYDERSEYGTGWADDKLSYYYYAICWTITKPSSKQKHCVYLGLYQTTRNSIFNKSISYTPSNTAKQVEIDIKNWLKVLFK